MTKQIEAFWNRFLEAKNLPRDTKYDEAFYFDSTKESAENLLKLVLEGKKKATSSSLYAYEATNEEMPYVGSLSIVTDFDHVPYAVIKTTAINVIPFKDMTYDIVKREGEDDCLSSWQENHIRAFKKEGEISGYTFDEKMPVVFEDFEVIYKE